MRTTAVNLSERAISFALRQTAGHIHGQGLTREHSREDVQTMVELGRAWLDFQDLKDWITAPLDDEDIFHEWLNKEPEDPHDSEPETPYQPGETVQGATPVHEVVEPIRVKVKPTLGDAVKIAMGVENAVRAIGMTRKSRTAMAEAGPLSLDYVDALKAWLCDQHGVTKNHLGLKPLEVDVLRQTIRAHAVNGQLVIPK